MEGARTLTKTWTGTPPQECDICHAPIAAVFIDGKTNFGPWANMCPTCHKTHGIGLGVGKGQRYHKEGEVWVRQRYDAGMPRGKEGNA